MYLKKNKLILKKTHAERLVLLDIKTDYKILELRHWNIGTRKYTETREEKNNQTQNRA